MAIRLLDLFCGAGGAGMGYHRAGFEVVGVDINPQPNYPFAFVRADAIQYALAHGWAFDAIHASPPCQAHSQLRQLHKSADYGDRHIDLIPQTRFVLNALGAPYVIENVPGARAALRNPITLCGATFGLKVYRHRLFESNVMLFAPEHAPHRDNTPSAGRGVSAKGFVSVIGSGGIQGIDGSSAAYKNMAMGIDWMTQKELAQSIPPAYTEYIGRQLMRAALARQEAAA